MSAPIVPVFDGAASTTEAGSASPPVSGPASSSTSRDVDQLLAWSGSHSGLALAEPLTITTRADVLTACRT